MRDKVRYTLITIVIAFYTYPAILQTAHGSLDSSWQTALHLIAAGPLSFGDDIGFTYGPLGFLFFPRLIETSTAALSMIAVTSLHMLFCGVTLYTLRNIMGWIPASIGTFALAQFLNVFDIAHLDVIGLTIYALAVRMIMAESVNRRMILTANAAFAFGGGLMFLSKTNYGVIALGVGFLFALWSFTKVRTAPLVWGATVFTTIALLWVLTGQALGDFARYIHLSGEVVSGYSSAMQTRLPEAVDHAYWTAALTSCLLATLVFLALRGSTRARQLTLALMTAMIVFLVFRQGFTRSITHTPIFFHMIALASVAWLGVERLRENRRFALLVPATFVVALLSIPQGFQALARENTQTGVTFFKDVSMMVSKKKRNQRIADSKDHLKKVYMLTPEIQRELTGHTVHVEPWETEAIWAYDLKWSPPPVFQSYSAYTEFLDDENARFYRDDKKAPERVLRESVALDGLNPLFETPATQLAILCNYKVVMQSSRWQVLARQTQEACSSMKPVGKPISTKFGKWIGVPETNNLNEIVIAKIDSGTSTFDGLMRNFLRDRHKFISVNKKDKFRILTATANNGLIMRAGKDIGDHLPTRDAVDYSRFRITAEGPFKGMADERFSVRFYKMEVDREPIEVARHKFDVSHGRFALAREGEDANNVISYGGVSFNVDAIEAQDNGSTMIKGWAIDEVKQEPIEKVVAFADNAEIITAQPDQLRPDVASFLGNEKFAYSGFQIMLPAPATTVRAQEIRFYAVSDGYATPVYLNCSAKKFESPYCANPFAEKTIKGVTDLEKIGDTLKDPQSGRKLLLTSPGGKISASVTQDSDLLKISGWIDQDPSVASKYHVAAFEGDKYLGSAQVLYPPNQSTPPGMLSGFKMNMPTEWVNDRNSISYYLVDDEERSASTLASTS